MRRRFLVTKWFIACQIGNRLVPSSSESKWRHRRDTSRKRWFQRLRVIARSQQNLGVCFFKVTFSLRKTAQRLAIYKNETKKWFQCLRVIVCSNKKNKVRWNEMKESYGEDDLSACRPQTHYQRARSLFPPRSICSHHPSIKFRYVRSLPYVDTSKVAVLGCGFQGSVAFAALAKKQTKQAAPNCGVVISPIVQWKDQGKSTMHDL